MKGWEKGVVVDGCCSSAEESWLLKPEALVRLQATPPFLSIYCVESLRTVTTQIIFDDLCQFLDLGKPRLCWSSDLGIPVSVSLQAWWAPSLSVFRPGGARSIWLPVPWYHSGAFITLPAGLCNVVSFRELWVESHGHRSTILAVRGSKFRATWNASWTGTWKHPCMYSQSTPISLQKLHEPKEEGSNLGICDYWSGD